MAELHGHGLGVDGCVEDPLPAAVPGVDGGGGHQVVGVCPGQVSVVRHTENSNHRHFGMPWCA